jgi:hypothetical protein
VQAYLRETRAEIPTDISQLPHNICLSDTYPHPTAFLDRLYLKARRDLYLPLGWGIMPQTPIEEDREWARTRSATCPATWCARISQYAGEHTAVPFKEQDLLSVTELRFIATSIETHCLNLVGKGYVDNSCLLPSMSLFAAALCTILGSFKEAGSTPEPWVTALDLQIFRTRCMYLFWCADWLEIYYARAAPGPYMVDNDEMEGALKTWRGEMAQMVQLLLRNWVACGFMIDSLPEWDLFVGQGV